MDRESYRICHLTSRKTGLRHEYRQTLSLKRDPRGCQVMRLVVRSDADRVLSKSYRERPPQTGNITTFVCLLSMLKVQHICESRNIK